MKKKRPNLDKLEQLETEDWVNDRRRREWKKSPDYKARKELADKFSKRKK